MSLMMSDCVISIMNSCNLLAISPMTGDKFKPWIAAVILIVSVIVLVGLFVFSKKDDSESESNESFDDDDE